jgi:PPP family 3-phenylpropionic acid transporter
MRAKPSTIYTAFYIGQFLFLGVQLPFLPGWLFESGFTESAIGWLTGGSLILRLLLGPVVAYWAEGQADKRIALVLLSGLMAASAVLMLIDQPLWSVGILVICLMWSFGCITPLSDTAVMRADRAGLINYGKARGIGSFAFIVGNLLGGLLIARYGDQVSIIWMAGACSLTFLIAFQLPKVIGVETSETPVGVPELSQAARLFRSKSFLYMLLAVGLVQGSHATYYYFSELHWSELGYGSDLIGVLWTVGVLAEIIVLYAGRQFVTRLGPVVLIALGAAGALIRWPLVGLSPPLPLLILLQCFHALTFAATYLGSVAFISRAIPDNLANTSMTLVSTLGVGAMTGLGAIAVGLFFTPQDAFTGYAMMGGMGGVALVMSWLLYRQWDGGIIRSERELAAESSVEVKE